MMKESRIKKILDTLMSRRNFCPASQLAELLDVSTRSIRDDIKKLNRILNFHGADIRSKSGAGYLLQITNSQSFEQFLATSWHRYAFETSDLNDPIHRKNTLLSLLFDSEKSLSIDTLLQQLQVSDYTLLW